MKKLLLLITFSLLCLFSFTQISLQQDQRVNQILKTALTSKSGYYIYGRTRASRFINIAVLNQTSHTLCWFTCHGRLFDSTKLTGQEFEQITSKQLDPFVLYQNICSKFLTDFAAAINIYRVYGDVQLLDKLNGNYRALLAMGTVQAAQTPLQKLIAIENIKKKILTQLTYLNCASPFALQDAPVFKISKERAGTMVQTKDSTIYYNIDPTSAVAKIILYKKSAGKLYIQNRFSEIIDSVAIQPEKDDLLQKEKTDVFLLYRGWLEMQWQGTLSAIRRQSAGLYSQVNVQNEKEVKELYNQLNAIAAKINQMNSPEEKSIDQAVYDTYKNETSEINYIPLLGIGYNLTQTRGTKEYELTNHLGNVLATVSDKKIGASSASNSVLVDHYEPDIVSAQDYYPFGMLQPGRSYLSATGDKYRYGFNGKENDNEVKGEGNQLDYGARIYDSRLSKWLSVDPLSGKFPGMSPFGFSNNSPIVFYDPDGKVVKAVTKEAQELIIRSLSPDEAKYVEFDKNGILNVQKLSLAVNDKVKTGGNYEALLYIANHKQVAELTIANAPAIKNGNGKEKVFKMAIIEEALIPDEKGELKMGKQISGVVGLSLTPMGYDEFSDFDKLQRSKIDPEKQNQSSNENFQVYISKDAFDFNKGSAAGTLSHEMFAHIYYILLGNKVKGGLHGPVRWEGADNATDENFNKELEKWIRERTKEGNANNKKYEENLKNNNESSNENKNEGK